MKHLLRDEYNIRRVTKVTANTLEELAAQARRRRPEARSSRPSRATTRRCAPTSRSIPTSRTAAAPTGSPIDKSNWANTIDEPPFEAYGVTCGITFTFGGLRIATERRGARYRYAQPIPGFTRPASWSAACSTSTIRAARASRRARCSAASPAPRPAAPGRIATNSMSWPGIAREDGRKYALCPGHLAWTGTAVRS